MIDLVDVVTWRDRTGCSPDQVPVGIYEQAMCEEIAELRERMNLAILLLDGMELLNE